MVNVDWEILKIQEEVQGEELRKIPMSVPTSYPVTILVEWDSRILSAQQRDAHVQERGCGAAAAVRNLIERDR